LKTIRGDRRCAWFVPTRGFWEIWRGNREGVRGENFYPVKTEDGWLVKWYGEGREIKDFLNPNGRERGERQRHSIISPNWSAITLKQVLGRIHRSGGKSVAIQRIVLVDGTVEGEIANRLTKKLKNIAAVNDAALEDDDML
jgi:hypothetical protein